MHRSHIKNQKRRTLHTILKVMDEAERTEEIARMLSGTTITALTPENAKSGHEFQT